MKGILSMIGDFIFIPPLLHVGDRLQNLGQFRVRPWNHVA